MNISKLALFLSGLFFGGAIDHVILAVIGQRVTPYGVVAGVSGNWALAALDLALTLVLLWVHRRRTEPAI
jgi:hypothetical protein